MWARLVFSFFSSENYNLFYLKKKMSDPVITREGHDGENSTYRIKGINRELDFLSLQFEIEEHERLHQTGKDFLKSFFLDQIKKAELNENNDDMYVTWKNNQVTLELDFSLQLFLQRNKLAKWISQDKQEKEKKEKEIIVVDSDSDDGAVVIPMDPRVASTSQHVASTSQHVAATSSQESPKVTGKTRQLEDTTESKEPKRRKQTEKNDANKRKKPLTSRNRMFDNGRLFLYMTEPKFQKSEFEDICNELNRENIRGGPANTFGATRMFDVNPDGHCLYWCVIKWCHAIENDRYLKIIQTNHPRFKFGDNKDIHNCCMSYNGSDYDDKDAKMLKEEVATLRKKIVDIAIGDIPDQPNVTKEQIDQLNHGAKSAEERKPSIQEGVELDGFSDGTDVSLLCNILQMNINIYRQNDRDKKWRWEFHLPSIGNATSRIFIKNLENHFQIVAFDFDAVFEKKRFGQMIIL